VSSEYVGAVAIWIDARKAALCRAQGSGGCALHSKTEKNVAIAVGSNGRVNEDSRVETSGVRLVVRQAGVKHSLGRHTGTARIGIVDEVNGSAGSRIVQADAGCTGSECRLINRNPGMGRQDV